MGSTFKFKWTFGIRIGLVNNLYPQEFYTDEKKRTDIRCKCILLLRRCGRETLVSCDRRAYIRSGFSGTHQYMWLLVLSPEIVKFAEKLQSFLGAKAHTNAKRPANPVDEIGTGFINKAFWKKAERENLMMLEGTSWHGKSLQNKSECNVIQPLSPVRILQTYQGLGP